MTLSNQRIDVAAAGWAVRLNARALTTEEQGRLDLWLAADARHRGALLRAQAAWQDLDRLAALAGRPDRDRSQARADEMASLPSTNRRSFLAASITVLSLGIAGAWWLERRNKTYASDVGQIRHVTLSDGSRMILNTATEATVRFDDARREIDLVSGEGLFQVVKDPARPFIVRAGSVSVRAVGTVFAVRSIDDRIDVTVTEGVVELRDDSPLGRGAIRRVAANEHASVLETRQVNVQSIPRNEAERQLAWRDGMADFAGESLGLAVEEINRHNRRRIVVDDPTLASKPVVGLFRTNDPNGFASTVAAALGARSVDLDDAIHLRLAASP